MKAQWGECGNALRGYSNLINLKVYSVVQWWWNWVTDWEIEKEIKRAKPSSNNPPVAKCFHSDYLVPSAIDSDHHFSRLCVSPEDLTLIVSLPLFTFGSVRGRNSNKPRRTHRVSRPNQKYLDWVLSCNAWRRSLWCCLYFSWSPILLLVCYFCCHDLVSVCAQ